MISGTESQLIAVSFIAIHLLKFFVGEGVPVCCSFVLFCLSSFLSSCENASVLAKSGKIGLYSNSTVFSGHLVGKCRKAFNIKALRANIYLPKVAFENHQTDTCIQDSKSSCPQGHVGSNPTVSANTKLAGISMFASFVI